MYGLYSRAAYDGARTVYGIRFSWKHVEHKQLKFPQKIFSKIQFSQKSMNSGKKELLTFAE